jgi:hypothetical protein
MKLYRLVNAIKLLWSRDMAFNVIGTVIGGIILSVIGFLYADIIYPVPSLTGGWILTQTTKHSRNDTIKGVTVFSGLQLLQQGCQITGSGSLTRHLDPGQKDTLLYTGEKKCKLDATGYLTQRLLNHATADFSIVQYSDSGSTTFTLILTVTDRNHMTGYFSSDADNSKGTVILERDNSYWRRD